MSEELLQLAREIAERASRREHEAWRDIFRRFLAMTPVEREAFLWHLDAELAKKQKPDS